MIELPESYVLADQINQTLVGKTVLNAAANASPHKFAWYSGDPAQYHQLLAGKTVSAALPGTVRTCGGNIEIQLDDMLLVLSTPVRYHAPGDKLPAKHQLWLEFEDFSSMTCTVQMWGAMFCFPADAPGGLPAAYAINPSPSPLEDAFDPRYFEALLSSVKPSLSAKAFLATEQRIPGLGNGVLQDILFRARVNPRTRLEQLADPQLDALFHSVKDTLGAMLAGGGRDTERDLFGASGGYATILSNKTLQKPCPSCGSAIIREAFLGGNIYYCPVCQPRPR